MALFTEKQRNRLQSWIKKHRSVYPSKRAVEKLSRKTKLTCSQVTKWFADERRRNRQRQALETTDGERGTGSRKAARTGRGSSMPLKPISERWPKANPCNEEFSAEIEADRHEQRAELAKFLSEMSPARIGSLVSVDEGTFVLGGITIYYMMYLSRFGLGIKFFNGSLVHSEYIKLFQLIIEEMREKFGGEGFEMIHDQDKSSSTIEVVEFFKANYPGQKFIRTPIQSQDFNPVEIFISKLRKERFRRAEQPDYRDPKTTEEAIAIINSLFAQVSEDAESHGDVAEVYRVFPDKMRQIYDTEIKQPTGIVFKCVNRQTGQIVAIKRYSESDEKDPVIRKIAMREVRVLRQLKHPNLINLIEVFRRKRRLHLVFDYCELTVLDVIEKYGNGCPLNLIRKIVWQIVNGTSYCHTRNCIHRDIKPENILINQSGVVKLCDFGFARTIEKPPSANQHTTQNESLNGSNGTLWNSKENVLNIDDTEPDSTIADRRALTEYVATRWYRAPELLIGEIYYDAKIDIWAIGCVTAELMRGEPIWPGKTDLDQLFIIKNSLGSLTPVQTSTLINRGVYDQVNIDRLLESGQSTAETVERKLPPRVGDSGIDFVSTCLQMDPERRPTCEQLLRHEYIHSARMAQFMKTANSSSLGSAQLPGSGRATILAPISEGEPTRATSDQPIRQQALDIQKQRANSQSLLVSTSKSQTPAQTVPGSRRLYTVGPKQIQNHHNTWSGFNGLGAKNKRVKQPDYDSATSRKDIDQTSKSPSRLINKTEPRSMVPVAKVRSKSDGSSLSVGGIVAFAPTKSESNRAELGNDNFRKQTKRQHNDLEKTPTEIDSGSYFSLNKQDFSSFSDRLMKSTLEREKSEIPRRANNSKSMHRETDNKAYFGGIRLDQQANVKKTIKTTGKSTICTDSSASSTVSDSNKSISQLPSVFNRLNNQQIVKSSKQVDQLPFSAGSPTKTLAMPGNLPKASNKLVPIAM